MPDERTFAVCRARDFLARLSSPYAGGIKGVKREVREEARRILRHYPHWFDLGRADAFDEAAAKRYGEQETGEQWWLGITPHQLPKTVTKRQAKARRAPK